MNKIVFLLLTFSCLPSQPSRIATPPAVRRPAAVMSFEGADWLERSSREEEERPGEVVAAMRLHDGLFVAEIGAGTGYMSRRMARVVAPHGRVYAEEIQPEMLALMKPLLEKDHVEGVVVPLLGTPTDPKLPSHRFDWILLVDVYHEFQQPKPMLAKMREALAPGGRVALVEYRAEGTTASHIRAEHRMSVEQVLAEWKPAGFELEKVVETLPAQHLFIFR
ncbi:MAG TPA: class I SAM-dependent methyltransferase [Thermoanaerobaculia bacterium]|nr:class I SAM-dependent methyltransferase [Thermoanaerobaculia bacterium]